MSSVAEFQPLLFGAMISLAAFLLLVLMARAMSARQIVRRRAKVAGLSGGSGLHARETGNAARIMAKLEPIFTPGRREDLSRVRKQLVQAGFFSASAVVVFYVSRILLAVVLPISLLASTAMLPVEIPSILIMILAACHALLGLVLPPIFLDFRTRSMREKYRRSFPDFMDLLVVCIESGQSLPSALDRVGREMIESCPELGANLHLVNLELRAGSNITTALQNLHGRLGIEEVRSLAVLLKQSEELGASIAATLRVFSDEMRDKRLNRAETRANALPVKMTLPLGLFIFPVILLVILIPVIIRIKNAFA
jgi:tight adherence protein C